MAEVMHILLKYSDSYYNVDTIKEHRTILADKGAVIWGLIKPDRNSPGMAPAKQGQIREQLRRGIPTYAYLATHGAIMHKARITNLYTTEEVENREELIPPYYHKDLNRCVSGFEFSSIEDVSKEEARHVMRIDGRALTLSNQTNPLYARVEEHEEIPPAQRPASQPGTSPHTPAALVEHVTGYINSLGFVFSREDIANFYLSLKTKPFVIMAGISGTGKSKLIRLFAESLGANSDNKRFRMVSVKPDWNDSADLFGYFDLTGAFRPGMLAEAFREASLTSNQNQPNFICLDEMNLARIEQYLGEYLSVIESRRRADDGRMTTDVLLQGGPALGTDYEGLRIPNNVYIVGTVNMDDSAFAFSRKVLDRANTIENNEVKLDEVEFSRKKLQSISISNALLSSRCLNIQQALEVDAAYALKINSWIIRLNDILSRNNKHFGYRVRDEMVCYMLENMLSGLLDEDLAFDYQIMQKVLPTLNGSDGVLRTILIELYNYCNEDIQIADNEQYIEDAEAGVSAARYQKSAAKIISMMKGFERGFVSYW